MYRVKNEDKANTRYDSKNNGFLVWCAGVNQSIAGAAQS